MTDETKTVSDAAVSALAGAVHDALRCNCDSGARDVMIAEEILASPALDALVAERVAGLAADELRVAALAHVIEWYAGPDDDTIPVLRHWLTALADREVGA